jgi:hypothetical protein
VTQATQGGARPSRVVGTVVVAVLSALCLTAAVALALVAAFVMCGISGCSGGGFGRSTDPPTTLALIVASGVALAMPIGVYAAWRRHGRLALAVVPAALVGAVLVGVVIGADWNGCPRGIPTATCQEERGP